MIEHTMNAAEQEAWLQRLRDKKPPPPRHVQQPIRMVGNRATKQFKPHRSDCTKAAAHHFVLEEPNGSETTGVCRHCGDTRVWRSAASELGRSELWGYRE